MNAWEKMQEMVPDLYGKYPVTPFPNGYAWRLPRSWQAVVLSANANYWDNGWKVMEDRPVEDHSGAWGWPHALASRIHLDGAIEDGPQPYRLLSMGVMERERYIPIWKPGALKVGDGAKVTQSLGPYDIVTDFEGCGRKQTILLPEMPSLAKGSIAIEYAVEGLLSPEKCPCKPEAIDAHDKVVPMQKRRIMHRGRFEMLPLDVLEGLTFPVVLDPTYTAVTSGPWARGQRCTYAAARNSASSWLASPSCEALGQYIPSPDYSVNRFGLKTNLNSAPGAHGTTLNAVSVKAACCSTTIVAAEGQVVFKQADWKAWDPPDLFTIENVYDAIRSSTLGADLWTPTELQTLGCFTSPNCVYCDWKPLSAADVTYLSTHYWHLASPDKYFYSGVMEKADHNNVPPVAVAALRTQMNSTLCGIAFLIDYGVSGGGWLWVVS